MATRTADSKGRVSLGDRFANRTVIVEEVDETEVRVILARVVPEREMWLQDNAQARKAVQQGLSQAAAGRFARRPPNLKADAALADQLKD